MRRSVILDTTVEVVFDAALVLSLYLLFAGHNQPGGGFVGGLVAGAAVALRYVAGGIEAVRPTIRARPWFILALGLGLAVATTAVPLLVGRSVLDQEAATWDLPLLGTIKASTALIFDAGVYLVVVGLVLMVFEALGDDSEPLPSDDTGGDA
jgi:multicomponent Na+:H+ antiporter subunit A